MQYSRQWRALLAIERDLAIQGSASSIPRAYGTHLSALVTLELRRLLASRLAAVLDISDLRPDM